LGSLQAFFNTTQETLKDQAVKVFIFNNFKNAEALSEKNNIAAIVAQFNLVHDIVLGKNEQGQNELNLKADTSRFNEISAQITVLAAVPPTKPVVLELNVGINAGAVVEAQSQVEAQGQATVEAQGEAQGQAQGQAQAGVSFNVGLSASVKA
jgi:hypothetical protein